MGAGFLSHPTGDGGVWFSVATHGGQWGLFLSHSTGDSWDRFSVPSQHKNCPLEFQVGVPACVLLCKKWLILKSWWDTFLNLKITF